MNAQALTFPAPMSESAPINPQPIALFETMKTKSKVEQLRNEADRLERQAILRLAKAYPRTVKLMRPKAAQINRLRSQAAAALNELERLAENDLDALNTLATELLFHVRRMNENALGNLDFVRTLTRHCSTWPATVSVDKDIQPQQTELANRLQLGKEATVNYTGRQWSRHTPEIRAALRVLSCLEGHQIKLPRFTRATAPAWWKAGRKFFVQMYGTDFENHPTFESYAKRGGTKRTQSADHVGLSRANWIRKQILSKMPQAFVSLAPKK